MEEKRQQGCRTPGSPEIDFCADTLESSHAYLEAFAAWPNTFGAVRNIFSGSERQNLRNGSGHSHPQLAQSLHFSSTGSRRHGRLLLWRAKAKSQGQTAKARDRRAR